MWWNNIHRWDSALFTNWCLFAFSKEKALWGTHFPRDIYSGKDCMENVCSSRTTWVILQNITKFFKFAFFNESWNRLQQHDLTPQYSISLTSLKKLLNLACMLCVDSNAPSWEVCSEHNKPGRISSIGIHVCMNIAYCMTILSRAGTFQARESLFESLCSWATTFLAPSKIHFFSMIFTIVLFQASCFYDCVSSLPTRRVISYGQSPWHVFVEQSKCRSKSLNCLFI